jgi:hypothetical protein
MPDDLHRHARMNLKICQQCGAGTTSVMDRDSPDAGSRNPRVPGPIEVARVDRGIWTPNRTT